MKNLKKITNCNQSVTHSIKQPPPHKATLAHLFLFDQVSVEVDEGQAVVALYLTEQERLSTTGTDQTSVDEHLKRFIFH